MIVIIKEWIKEKYISGSQFFSIIFSADIFNFTKVNYLLLYNYVKWCFFFSSLSTAKIVLCLTLRISLNAVLPPPPASGGRQSMCASPVCSRDVRTIEGWQTCYLVKTWVSWSLMQGIFTAPQVREPHPPASFNYEFRTD